MRTALLGLAVLASLTGCRGCAGTQVVQCTSDAQCAPLQCVDGLCVDATDGGTVTGCDPSAADNDARDTDCDGISDAEEYSKVYASGLSSDPCRADSDGDGLADGLEAGKTSSPSAACTFTADADPGSRTDPTAADTDGDGASDSAEDLDKDGRVDSGESSPNRKDSDCDGLTDGEELAGTRGCPTAPTHRDTDGDGIADGVEAGATAPGPDPACLYSPGSFDTDPAKTTNACVADTDGDGITDGAEDSNQNGKVDPGELDPNDPLDGTGPVGEVCAASKLRPVVLRRVGTPNFHLALPASFDPANGGQLAVINLAGVDRGLMGYSSANKVAFLAYTMPAPAGSTSAVADEAAVRLTLDAAGALSSITTQTFNTWDSHPATQAFYTQAGAADLVTRANDLATALVGNGAGVLTGPAGVTGPFQLQAEYVHRSAQEVVVVLALTRKTNYVEPALFVMGDTAGGSALASFVDFTGVQCEPFAPARPKVDFLFSVDDSASMPQEQTALASAATSMAAALNNSTLDWRIAMVTTSYLAAPQAGSNKGVVRGFSRDIGQFRSWLTQNSVCNTDAGTCTLVSPAPPCDSNGPALPDGRWGGCWIGAGGTGNVAAEAILGAARKALNDLTPGTVAERRDRVRDGATVVVVLMGDADDQTTGYTTSSTTASTWEPIGDFVDFFKAAGTTQLDKNKLGVTVKVHGIVCPEGGPCTETQATPRRHVAVINATGGVLGNINDLASIPGVASTITQSAIGAAGHALQRPPIGASIKVAVDAVATPAQCTPNDVPRSRENGFDYDGVNQTLSLYGACRPGAGSTRAAVSYRYWVKGTGVCACPATHTCDPVTNQCVCLPDCGGSCPVDTTCEPTTCSCIGGIN